MDIYLGSRFFFVNLFINVDPLVKFGFEEWAKELVNDSRKIVEEDVKISGKDSLIQNIAYEYHLNEMLVYLGLDNHFEKL